MSTADPITYLGNPSVHEAQTDEGRVTGHTPRPDLGAAVTEVHWQPEVVEVLKREAKTIATALDGGREALVVRVLTATGLAPWEVALKHVLMVVAGHAREGINWVAAEDAKLEAILSQILEADMAPRGMGAALALAKIEGERWDEITAGIEGPTALKTTAGVDLIAGNCFGESAAAAQLNYVALTANNEAEKSSNTSLAGEIATAGGGLIRKKATYAHTNGTSTATLTVTFTANGSDALPVTAHKFGVFNKATSGGTMGIETKVTEVTFNAAEDNETLTETITIT